MENKETPVFSCSLCELDIKVVFDKVDDERLSLLQSAKTVWWPKGVANRPWSLIFGTTHAEKWLISDRDVIL